MKRDLDTIRYVLLRLEEIDRDCITPDALVDDDHSEDEVKFHLRLLADVNYIKAHVAENISGYYTVVVYRITMQGYDYLDSVRDPNIWGKIKEKLQKLHGGAVSVALDIVKSIGTELILKLLSD